MHQSSECTDEAPPQGPPTSKRLVQVLILIGLGIPILIEAATLVRLIGGHLGGDEDGRSTGNDTADVVMVDEGDELLPATAAPEIIARASVRAQLDAWYFVIEVDVQNPAAHSYELTLRDVETRGGRMIDASHTQRWPPGDSARMRAEWELPEGDRPVSMYVSGRLLGAADSTQRAARRVHFDHIPVRMWD